MEYVVALGIIYTGYLLTKKDEDSKFSKIKKIPSNKLPNGDNIYQSEEFNKVEGHVRELSTKMFKKAANKNSTVVVPGPPTAYLPGEINKVNKSSVPVEANMYQNNNSVNEVNKRLPNVIYQPKRMNNSSGGFSGISLTGEKINPSKFVHNNMVPFFGSTVKQNIDEKANQSTVENFTGNFSNYQMKKEVKTMFKPQNNVTNPYGMQSMSSFEQDRYYVSNRRNNEAPIEQIRVGPGLNQGYTSKPSGGFQQADTRDYILPKNVDELRVQTNPKRSYQGRINGGKRISKPGKIGVVNKNLPDSFYINNPDRYFTTVGAIEGPKQRPNILVKPTNRKDNNRFHIGPATNVSGNKNGKRDITKYKKSTKQVLNNYGWRNLEKVGEWLGDFFDYGKKTTSMKTTLRQQLADKNRTGNIQTGRNAPIYNKNLRATRKTNVIGNSRQAGNAKPNEYRGYVKDEADVARTTMKETTLEQNFLGNANAQTYKNSGYKVRKYKFDETNRETTSIAYVPNAEATSNTKKGGYRTNKFEAKPTIRGDVTVDYTGNAHGENKPISHEAACNSTVRSIREDVAKGRAPSNSGPKKTNGAINIKMTTRRTGDLKNKILNKRGVISTKTYNSLPQIDKCNETRDKMTVPNEPLANRLDPGVIDQLRENPFTRSLSSSS